MKKIKINGVKEEIIHEVLDNGLNIYLVPNNNIKNYYMTFTTKFGSVDTEFKRENDKSYIKVPNGVAHFLEHITFKMKNDEDASDYFAELGSSSNAYTSFKVTCYEVFGYDKFKENLNTLIDFVQTPYYTEKIVEAEKGIIKEEVKMYEDQVDTSLIFESFKMMLNKDNSRNLVAGTVDDVDSITLDDILNCYNTFYHPSNMFITITGNFNVEEAISIIYENQIKREFENEFKIVRKKKSELPTVLEEYREITKDIEIEKVNIGLKIPLSSFKSLKLRDEELRIYLNVITESFFGRSSELKERLVSGNIVTDGLYVNRSYLDDYLLLNIIAETPYPNRYIEIMNEAIENITIDEADLKRKKRVAISNLIRSFDDIEEINFLIQSDIINYGKIIPDINDLYNSLNYDVALSIINKINVKNKSILVINKNN